MCLFLRSALSVLTRVFWSAIFGADPFEIIMPPYGLIVYHYAMHSFSLVISSVTRVFLKHVVSFPDIWGFPWWFSAVGSWLNSTAAGTRLTRLEAWAVAEHAVCAEVAPGALGGSVSLPCRVGCLCVSGLAGCSVVHVFSVSPDFLTSCSVQLSSIGYLHLRCLIFSFQFCRLLRPVFWDSYIGGACSYKCCIIGKCL